MSEKTIQDIINAQEPPSEYQVGGDHYLNMPIQPWDLMKVLLTEEEWRGYLKGCLIKYSMRAGRKEGSDDWGKAKHNLEKLKQEREAWNY